MSVMPIWEPSAGHAGGATFRPCEGLGIAESSVAGASGRPVPAAPAPPMPDVLAGIPVGDMLAAVVPLPGVDLVRAQRDLDYLVEAWPLLIELRIPGTRRRWTQRSHRVISPEASSAGSAPVDLGLLDLLADLATLADDLARTIESVLGSLARQPSISAWADPRPHLAFVRAWLEAADEVDDRSSPWVLDQLFPLVRAVSARLGEARHGQVLEALCPWCGGRSEEAPTGGARTLILRMPSSDGDLSTALIVCAGTNCRPPESACAHRDAHGRPAWPWREWDWLATQLRPAAKASGA